MHRLMCCLFWKEWREHRWKTAFVTLLLSGYLAIGLTTRFIPDYDVCILGLMIAVQLLGILASMDLVAAERVKGSTAFLLSLPIDPRWTFVAKLAIGSMICTIPLGAAACVIWLVAGTREMSMTGALLLCLWPIGFTLSLFVWTLTLSMGQSNEARVGLWSVGILFAWVALVVAVETLEDLWFPAAQHRLSLLITPFGFMRVSPHRIQHPELIFIHLPVIAAMCVWGAIRFSRLGRAHA